jgi:hypothetical protein
MAYALIDLNAAVVQTPGQKGPPPVPPVYYPNSARVAQVVPTVGDEFPIARPLAWLYCPDTVVADQWYFNTQTGAFIQITSSTQS